MTDAHAIPRSTLAAMVRVVAPTWELREATPAERGFSPVYHLVVETADGPRRRVLKTAPEGVRYGIATEARLLAVVAEHTDIPVPPVVGAVDVHDELPAPFFLMESMPGAAIQFEETGRVADRVLRRVARQSGEHLRELHALDAVDAFGVVGHESAGPLRGGRPAGDVRQLRVVDGADSWPGYLRASIERELERFETAPDADLAPRLRSWFDDRIDRLDGPFSPVLGRIDHGLHNLLVDLGSGDVASVLDWGFALAVTPGYDLQCVEYVLGGAVLSAAPGVPDRRALVREALLDGYGPTARRGDPLAEDHALYELLAVVRAANHLHAGVAKVPAERRDAVAAGLRNELAATLESTGA